MRVPRPLQERALALSTRMEGLSKSLGRAPKVREVAASLGWALEDVLETQDAATSYEAASLDAPVARDDGDAATLVDLLGRVDVGYELVESRDAMGAKWRALPDIEREVLGLRFMHDLTHREIGERIGYSQMHVSRLLRRALDALEQEPPPKRGGAKGPRRTDPSRRGATLSEPTVVTSGAASQSPPGPRCPVPLAW